MPICSIKWKIHDIQLTFVTLKIHQWEMEEKEVNILLPYLSRHLGHHSLDETYYYYQRIRESLIHIKQKDTAWHQICVFHSEHMQ